MSLVYVLAGLGVLLFLANLHQAAAGIRARRKWDRESHEHRVKQMQLDAAKLRLDSLRESLRTRFQERYPQVVEPVDANAALAIGALLRGDICLAIRQLDAASDAAQQLLGAKTAV